MIKNDKFPHCPWCGEKMVLAEEEIFEMEDGWAARLQCGCGADSAAVFGKQTKEEAINALCELKPIKQEMAKKRGKAEKATMTTKQRNQTRTVE